MPGPYPVPALVIGHPHSHWSLPPWQVCHPELKDLWESPPSFKDRARVRKKPVQGLDYNVRKSFLLLSHSLSPWDFEGLISILPSGVTKSKSYLLHILWQSWSNGSLTSIWWGSMCRGQEGGEWGDIYQALSVSQTQLGVLGMWTWILQEPSEVCTIPVKLQQGRGGCPFCVTSIPNTYNN